MDFWGLFEVTILRTVSGPPRLIAVLFARTLTTVSANATAMMSLLPTNESKKAS